MYVSAGSPPRARGARMCYRVVGECHGLTPRARGAQADPTLQEVLERLTPAGAGSTSAWIE